MSVAFRPVWGDTSPLTRVARVSGRTALLFSSAGSFVDVDLEVRRNKAPDEVSSTPLVWRRRKMKETGGRKKKTSTVSRRTPATSREHYPQRRRYKPFMAAHSGSNVSPPPGSNMNSVGLQQDPGHEGKKSKFEKYGNTDHIC
ncbi:uncharacterized protein EV420DRAFT_1654853 [Desarmillaria tabescens]|uniref:Uncharacterized protein n=1 Tax=Armillaria tabescens TaxID=1929756 RepID=A0AA39IZB2_ARMTA|nr:uncharacterized protein EV420DRAFT_1654853 [Desarmillaria tabescens]KAK0433223.1 hypothetical protein EV420DRAFT_1654853 [Desarmillaria tabescens]